LKKRTNRWILTRVTQNALLISLSVILRQIFVFLPNIQPLTALFLLIVRYFNLLDSLLVMSLTMLITGFLDGFGYWVVMQIVSFTIIILLWTLLARKLKIKSLAVLSAVWALLYGLSISFFSSKLFGVENFLSFYLNGLSFDLLHALATMFCFPLLAMIFEKFT